MGMIVNTVRYKLHVYTRTSKLVMPLAVLLLLVYLIYAVMPVWPADSYAVSATILCFAATWVGFTFADIEDAVSEQLIVLKLGSIPKYQVAYTLCLALIGLAYALLAVVFPLVVNLVNGFALYQTPVTFQTVLGAFALHSGAAFMGTAVGALFHPRLLSDRKIALMLVAFVLIVGFVKTGLHKWLPAAAYITWIFPPIAEIPATFAGDAAFAAGELLTICLWHLGYGAALTLLRMALLAKKLFG